MISDCHGPRKRATQVGVGHGAIHSRADARVLGGPIKSGHDKFGIGGRELA
jgi:hypothetical protein